MKPHLTARERQFYDLLRLGGIIDYRGLALAVYGEDLPGIRDLIKSYILRLRRKGYPIENARGIGYYLTMDNRCPTCGRELPA